MQEMWIWSLSGEDSLGEAMATHSSILAWEIPSLLGYSPQGHKELRRIEWLSMHAGELSTRCNV